MGVNTIKGKIKFFNEQKGFGFIVGEDEREYFVHVSKISEEVDTSELLENTEVEFIESESDRGYQANDIKLC